MFFPLAPMIPATWVPCGLAGGGGFLSRDQPFNDAPIDWTFCFGVRGNLLQIAGRVGRFDAGGGCECLKFCRREVILIIADNLANPREVEGLPDTRSVGFVLLGES